MLTDQTVISAITILEDGQIQVRWSRRFFDAAAQLAETYQRGVLEPGQDVSQQPVRLQAICAVVWTPAVIAAYQMAKAARS